MIGLGAMVESFDEAIIGKTLDGIITSWNKGVQKVFGYSAEEIVGETIFPEIPDKGIPKEPA